MFRFFCKVWSENFRINDLMEAWINLENRARKKKSSKSGEEGYTTYVVVYPYTLLIWAQHVPTCKNNFLRIGFAESKQPTLTYTLLHALWGNDSVVVQTTNKLIKYISTPHQLNNFKLPLFMLCDSCWQHCRQSVSLKFRRFLPCLFKWRRAECVDGKEVKVTNLCRKLKCESVTSLRVWR